MPVKDLTVSGSPDLKPDLSQISGKRNLGRIRRPDAAQPERPQKVGFVSLGCPKNLVDSEVMMGLLARAGAELTRRAEDADVIVVNTCSFIESAQQESVNTILEMAAHKTGGKAKKLVVAGCLVERFRDQIRKDIPEVDAVVGTGELEKILAATGLAPAPQPATEAIPRLWSCLRGRKAMPAPRKADSRANHGMARSPTCPTISTTTPRRAFWPRRGHMAYIKIAEGCDHPCTFCIIPQLRGQFRSRRFESVIAEAERLAQSGVREITLIGQDTTCYGEDFGLKDGLALLLEKLAAIEDLRWVRFLYAYPNKITGKLAGHDRAARKNLFLHGRPAAACLRVGAEAHEARRRRRCLPALDRQDAPHRCRT